MLLKFELRAVKSKYFFVEFDKEISNICTRADIQNIQQQILNSILDVENCKDFCSSISNLCPYCEYANNCTS